MDINLIWQTIVIFALGTFILRIGGRRSISQMTIPQTVIMIAIGTLLIQPVTGKGFWTTFVVGGILVLCLIFTEYIQLKFDGAETAISGKAVLVIENGTINEKNLQKLRLPVDKLEARLRQTGITAITDVELATVESSGELGYALKREKQPATKEDIQMLIQLIQTGNLSSNIDKSPKHNIFNEIINTDESHPPDYLQ
ncbi:DUF421 domain-containing protein [Bacillus sp. S/N-304-OC-R1]|uniref:DUF421 domain-containing protein n=1 Tax=Bacillus sp. S/N-304-OC-R1 TaxID=2758034 RepID=UPI001C8E138B|nr:DUF421 domain-containing protein [Bacillus sp. S/N-304-OC-R1]MBY0123744.1 DUF421 domain-containing protein [Bacillus sp. S/N-304-OC-R1]